MSGEFGPSEEDMGLSPEDKTIDKPPEQITKVEEKPEFSEASKAIYSSLIKDERRIIGEIEVEGIRSPKRGEFVGVELQVLESDDKGYEWGALRPFSPSDEEHLLFPRHFDLKFKNPGSGAEEGVTLLCDQFADQFYNYSSILDKFEETRDLNLDEEGRTRLIQDLDQQRADIHNQTAAKIADEISRGSRPIEISFKNAKTLFELMYTIDCSSRGDSFDLDLYWTYGVQLTPKAIQTLKDQLKEGTGCDIFARPSAHFHADEPEGDVSYNIRLLGDRSRSKIPQAKELAYNFVRGLHGRKNFEPLVREVYEDQEY